MGISDRHILVPYLWIRPISSWVRFGVKNQKKVDNAVVFGLRGMHNHTHLGHVMGYVVIGDVFRWFGAFFGVRGPPGGSANPMLHIVTSQLRRTQIRGVRAREGGCRRRGSLVRRARVCRVSHFLAWGRGPTGLFRCTSKADFTQLPPRR